MNNDSLNPDKIIPSPPPKRANDVKEKTIYDAKTSSPPPPPPPVYSGGENYNKPKTEASQHLDQLGRTAAKLGEDLVVVTKDAIGGIKKWWNNAGKSENNKNSNS